MWWSGVMAEAAVAMAPNADRQVTARIARLDRFIIGVLLLWLCRLECGWGKCGWIHCYGIILPAVLLQRIQAISYENPAGETSLHLRVFGDLVRLRNFPSPPLPEAQVLLELQSMKGVLPSLAWIVNRLFRTKTGAAAITDP
jgi:hypothetical protein